MILGFRDRFSDQIGQLPGHFNPGLGGPGDAADPSNGDGGGPDPTFFDGDPYWETNTLGDIIRACWNPNGSGQTLDTQTGAWEWEGSAACPTTLRSPGEPGPGDGLIGATEWYWRDDMGRMPGSQLHHETSIGSLAMRPRFTEVVNTAMNPFNSATSGLRYLTNATGDETGAYEVVDSTALGDTFGKGAGVGDVEMLCSAAPVQIGNRVWIDDGTTVGVQDPSEAPVPDGTTVNLYSGTTLVGQTTTSAGLYVFGGASGAGMLGGNRVVPGQSYTVSIVLSDLPAGLNPTVADVGGAAGDERDSDGTIAAAPGMPWDGHVAVTATAGGPGRNDHSFDFGFRATPAPSPSYDLALRKQVTSSTSVEPGDLVLFTITLFNQGSVAANNIVVLDTYTATDFEPFSVADNPAGTTGGTAALAYSWAGTGSGGRVATTGALPAGGQLTIPVYLTVATTAAGVLSNYAEIDVDDGADIDSTPEGDQANGNADPRVDDEIDGAGGDEDDEDIAQVTVGIYAIPTVGEWGLVLLGLLLAAAMVQRLRRAQ